MGQLTRFSDVVICLHDGKQKQMDCVKIEFHEEFKMLFVTDKAGQRRFSCHVDDLLWVEEDPTEHGDPIREQVMAIVCNKSVTGHIQKIPGIKKCRELLGLGLKEAKDQVDEWCKEEGI